MTDKLRATVLSAVGLVIMSLAGPALANPVELFPGRWSGWGQVIMDGGNTERVKCIATYFKQDAGRGLRHNLRCASANYTIDAVARLVMDGSKVSGVWEERKYVTGGVVTGAVISDGLSVEIVGEAFKAKLDVATTKCRQTMKIAPTGMGIRSIAVELAKC